MKIVILAYFVAEFWCTSAVSPVVETSSGKVEGIRSLSDGLPVKMFLGIPYATPPVRKLRFLRPKPVEPWSNTLKATQQPPACIQYTKAPFPWYDNMTGKSEDCLYLDIYTPILASKFTKYPVMFWIFGGGLTLGSNRLDVYDGRVLAARENVIVVTINYRLGLFGFLTTNTSDAPGNVGLYDQVMALNWVNDNIQYFGGDKNKITLFGESAGAVSVSALCISPLTKGKFSKAILESGTVLSYKENNIGANLKEGQNLAKLVDCASDDVTIYNSPSKVVECLRGKDDQELIYQQWVLNPSSSTSFFLQYGDTLLPNNALEDVRNGNFHNVPILAGNNRDEGSLFLTTANPNVFGFFGKKDTKVNMTYARSLLQGTFGSFPDPKKYIDYYLSDVSDDNYDLIRDRVHTAMGDTAILCATVYFGENYAQRGNDVYFYFFTHRPSNSIWADWMGVAHFDEVQFVFGRPVRVRKDYKLNEVTLSRRMMRAWANFAKTGRPSSKWPKYSRKDHTFLTIDVKNYGELGVGPHLPNCNFLRSYYNL